MKQMLLTSFMLLKHTSINVNPFHPIYYSSSSLSNNNNNRYECWYEMG